MLEPVAPRQALPFRYPGGKHYAIDILRPFWSCVSHNEYREPFAGGATVFFNKEKVKFNWLNDIDDELMTTYRVLSNPILRKKLAESVAHEVASRERWREIRQLCPSNDFEKAFKYFYLNRTSFSGKLSSPAWGYRPKRSLPPERWHERIIPCGQKIEDVKITQGDFEEVITSPPKERQVLMYVDPPYFMPPKTKHYRNGFDLSDHLRLAAILKRTNIKFFLTYDDCSQVRDLYKWANIHEVKFFYRVDNARYQVARKRKTGFELVITNYSMPKQLDFFN